jgi:hypothetical protein
MFYGDECILRANGIEIDPKELTPLNIVHGAHVWGVPRRHKGEEGNDVHFILSPIPPDAWATSFRLAVRLSDKPGQLGKLCEVLELLNIDILTAESTPAGFTHSVANLICELPPAFKGQIATLRKSAMNNKKRRDHRECLIAMNLYYATQLIAWKVRLCGFTYDARGRQKSGYDATKLYCPTLFALSFLSTAERLELIGNVSDGKCVNFNNAIDEMSSLLGEGTYDHSRDGIFAREQENSFLDLRFLFARDVYVDLQQCPNDLVDRADSLIQFIQGSVDGLITGEERLHKVDKAFIEMVQSGASESSKLSRVLLMYARAVWQHRISRCVETTISPTLLTLWDQDDAEQNAIVFKYDSRRRLLKLVKDARLQRHRTLLDNFELPALGTASFAYPENFLRIVPIKKVKTRYRVRWDIDYQAEWTGGSKRPNLKTNAAKAGPTVGLLARATETLGSMGINIIRAEAVLKTRPLPVDLSDHAVEIGSISIVGDVRIEDGKPALSEHDVLHRLKSTDLGAKMKGVEVRLHARIEDLVNLFISTRFASDFWIDEKRRKRVLKIARNHGFDPHYVDLTQSAPITSSTVRYLRNADCVLSLLPMNVGETFEEVNLNWPAAEYLAAISMNKPVVRVVDLRNDTLTLDDWKNRFKLDADSVFNGYRNDDDLFDRVLPLALDSLKRPKDR